MSRIRGRDTQPEMKLRSALHAIGLRFRLHISDLPGRPDIVLPKHRLAVFVHGCFWHRHAECKYCTTPASNAEFWRQKFSRNVKRDLENSDRLVAAGWRVYIAWECEIKRSPVSVAEAIKQLVIPTEIAPH